MRRRMSAAERRDQIVERARELFHEKGFASTEMEDIRLATGISRGGLYHHFDKKAAILEELVDREVRALAEVVDGADDPLAALLSSGSSHLGADPGVVTTVSDGDERRLYLASLDEAIATHLSPRLASALAGHTRPDVDPADVAELFLTVNAHINRRTLLGHWTDERAASFAATGLRLLGSALVDPTPLAPLIRRLDEQDRAG